MALPDLEDHLASHGVDPALSSHLVSNGWTSQNFAMIVESKAAFTDEIWSELSDAPIPLVQRANLKVAWQLYNRRLCLRCVIPQGVRLHLQQASSLTDHVQNLLPEDPTQYSCKT